MRYKATLEFDGDQLELPRWLGTPEAGLRRLIVEALERVGVPGTVTAVEALTPGQAGPLTPAELGMPSEREVLTRALETAALASDMDWPPDNVDAALREVLIEAGATDECENSDVLSKWELGVQEPATSTVWLYFDGGDAYEPGVVYVRRDNGVWRVHVPPTRELQRAHWSGDERAAIGSASAYLAGILGDPGAWRLLSEAENGPELMQAVCTLDEEGDGE